MLSLKFGQSNPFFQNLFFAVHKSSKNSNLRKILAIGFNLNTLISAEYYLPAKMDTKTVIRIISDYVDFSKVLKDCTAVWF